MQPTKNIPLPLCNNQIKVLLVVVAVMFALVTDSHAQTYDFTYGYTTVYDSNANQYITGISNVQKVTEPGSGTPVTYWGPSENNVTGLLTSEFTFSAPTSEIFLYAELASFNFGIGYTGASSLYGSTDGLTWTLLLNDPTPTSATSYLSYDQDVPSSLLGTTTFYLQARLLESNTIGSDSMAQFSRSGGAPGQFTLDANVIPEPKAWMLCVTACMILACNRASRKWKSSSRNRHSSASL